MKTTGNKATWGNGNLKPGIQTPQGIEALSLSCHPECSEGSKAVLQHPDFYVALSGFSALVANEMTMKNLQSTIHNPQSTPDGYRDGNRKSSLCHPNPPLVEKDLNQQAEPGIQTPQGIEALSLSCHPERSEGSKPVLLNPESFVALIGFSALVANGMKMKNPLPEQSVHQAQARAAIPPTAGLDPFTRNPLPETLYPKPGTKQNNNPKPLNF